MSIRQALERNGSDRSGDGTSTVLTAGGVAATGLSIAGSLVAYGILPGTVRIHWTLGGGPYYGPEHAPTALVLLAFPAFVGILAIGARQIAARLERTDEFAGRSTAYTLLVLTALVSVLVAQAVIIGANI
ncbi:hypothetical protein [Halopiger aswanensis]|uniref:DUF1648 domain-containing protein n=1 Tax=Halopiger aswanensis TaxID=148449 RepID=A0A419WHM7_9EURY|nr:hypothetical protein [Halopiger aswanensis]RKD95051.1 hypothetical protein ATJ93_1901 [Halopiger aswanensis]